MAKRYQCPTPAGQTAHPLWKTYSRMVDRCTNPNAHNYRWYGAKGVTVCERWLRSFGDFAADVGQRPNGTTLDRYPDRFGNYEPGNVRWATQAQQTNNMRNNIVVEHDGRTMTLKQWSRALGLSYIRLYNLMTRRSETFVDAVRILQDAGARPVTRSDSRGREIRAMLAAGKSTREICESLGVRPPTVSRWRHLDPDHHR